MPVNWANATMVHITTQVHGEESPLYTYGFYGPHYPVPAIKLLVDYSDCDIKHIYIHNITHDETLYLCACDE